MPPSSPPEPGAPGSGPDPPARDATWLCERLANRYAASGFDHPVAAAAASAARGAHALTIADYAELIGVEPSLLQAAEAGLVAWVDLPPALGADLSTHGGVDLLALADLERHHTAHAGAHPRAEPRS